MTVRRKEIIATLKGMYERPLQRINDIRARVEKQSFGPRGTDVCAAGDLMALLLSMEDDVIEKHALVKKSMMPHGEHADHRSDYMGVTRELFTFDACPPMLLYQVCYNEYDAGGENGDPLEFNACSEQYFVGLDDAMNCFHRRLAARNPRECGGD